MKFVYTTPTHIFHSEIRGNHTASCSSLSPDSRWYGPCLAMLRWRLGALRREGFHPARRHPSASRRPPLPSFSQPSSSSLSSKQSPNFHPYPYVHRERSPSPPRDHGGREVPVGRQRSFSAPPIRPAPLNLSADVKQARAMSAARFVADQAPFDEEEMRQDPFREIYEWLKEESLHEHLPSLLSLGVCELR